ncbi:MAG: SpoIID/LytB domain-containing protein [Phycisphaeraceae bacterium]
MNTRLFIPALVATLALFAGCRPGPKPDTTRVPPPKSDTHPHAHDQLTGEERLDAKRGPRADAVRAEPDLRIRIARALDQTMLTSSGSVRVGPGRRDLGKARDYTFQTPLRIHHDKQGFVLTEPSGKSVRWRLASLSIHANAGGVGIDGQTYPGELELVAQRSDPHPFTGRFDAVNHVGMESYLPGVLSKELYASWDTRAYRAQAIAARSYAIWEMNLPMRKASHFDLEASQASQAYTANASDKAKAAVADTAGQVLVFEHRVLPAFYSSCSGGTGQDAVAAWPGKVDDLAPLRGREHGMWGQASTKFRWGPIERDRAALSKRIAAWGKVNKHAVASLGTIARVEVAGRNRVGRPTTMRISDTAGRSFDLACEDLRMASNYRAPGLPTVDMNNLVYSSHAEYAVSADTVSITGRGFGHGVGMCQFGAQHMASEGHDHNAILGFYYPGAEVRKVY